MAQIEHTLYQCQSLGLDIGLSLHRNATLSGNWVKGTEDLLVLFLQFSVNLYLCQNKNLKIRKLVNRE